MNTRNPFVQAAFLVLLSVAIAVTANAFAARQRRLLLVGYYPNALKVPPRNPKPVLPVPMTTTAAQSPAPGQPPVAIETGSVGTTATVQPPPAPAATATAVPPAAVAPVPAAPARATALARFRPHPDQAAVEISGDDAALLHGAGALFLDARRTSVYEEGHIAGARSFPVWESDIDDRVSQLFSERSDPEQQNQPIVIYCSGGACEDSHMLAQKLWGVQFNNVYVYKDGFPDWQKRGGAVRTGGQP